MLNDLLKQQLALHKNVEKKKKLKTQLTHRKCFNMFQCNLPFLMKIVVDLQENTRQWFKVPIILPGKKNNKMHLFMSINVLNVQ